MRPILSPVLTGAASTMSRFFGTTARFVVSLLVATCFWWLIKVAIQQPNECEMTFMRGPRLFPVKILNRERSTFKYTLLRYAQYGIRGDIRKPTGSPVLFLPGHLGSAMQARSLGSHAVRLYDQLGDASRRPLDVYTVDFNEEWSGLSGFHLADQAEFVNSAVRTILAQYSVDNTDNEKHLSGVAWQRPQHVVIVAHSMAGVAARAALTLDNHRPGSIQTIITLSSPHQRAPFRLDSSIGALYDSVNAAWEEAAIFNQSEAAFAAAVARRRRLMKQAAQTAEIEAAAAAAAASVAKAADPAGDEPADESGSSVSDAAPVSTPKTIPEPTRPKYHHPKKLLSAISNTNVISVSGGHQDQLIHADLTRLEGLVNLDKNGLQFLSTDLEGGVSADHLAILWCYQVTEPVTASILAITDAKHGWVPAAEHLSIMNATLRAPSAPEPPVLRQAAETVLLREYAPPSHSFASRVGFVVHGFLVKNGMGALGFWLATFACILSQFVSKPAVGSKAAPRTSLALAVWPDHHNPAFFTPTSRSVRRVVNVLLVGLCCISVIAEYGAPLLPPGLFHDALFAFAKPVSHLGVAPAVLAYLLAAAASTLVLHFLDNIVWSLSYVLRTLRFITPRPFQKVWKYCWDTSCRHGGKLSILVFVCLSIAAHSMSRVANEGVDFEWTFRRPCFALELALIHVFVLALTGVGFLRLLVGLAGAPRTRAAEYQRMIVWGYICFVPVAAVQGVASFEVLTRAPAVLLRNYSWRAVLHILTLIPVALHLNISRWFPIEAVSFSPDSTAEDEALAQELEDKSVPEEEESKTSARSKPDYAARLAKRQAARRRRSGCEHGPHEFGARWSVYEEDEEFPSVVKHEFANGEVVFEGPVFRVVECNCAGEGLDPSDWCSFCRCKVCGVRTWEAFNGNNGRGFGRSSPGTGGISVPLALQLTALAVIVFCVGAEHRIHLFGGFLAVQALIAHMQASPELRSWYNSR